MYEETEDFIKQMKWKFECKGWLGCHNKWEGRDGNTVGNNELSTRNNRVSRLMEFSKFKLL